MSIKQDSHSYLVTTNKDDSILIPHAINPRAKVTLEKVMNTIKFLFGAKYISNFVDELPTE